MAFCCCRYLDSWTCLCGAETFGSCIRKLPGSRTARREPLRVLEVFPRGILRESRSAVTYWSESIGSNELCRYLSLSYYQSINGVLIRVWSEHEYILFRCGEIKQRGNILFLLMACSQCSVLGLRSNCKDVCGQVFDLWIFWLGCIFWSKINVLKWINDCFFYSSFVFWVLLNEQNISIDTVV